MDMAFIEVTAIQGIEDRSCNQSRRASKAFSYIATSFNKLASGCCGFTRTFDVSGTSTQGTCNKRERFSESQRSPMAWVELMSCAQSVGRERGSISSMESESEHSILSTWYRSGRSSESISIWTRVSSRAVAGLKVQ